VNRGFCYVSGVKDDTPGCLDIKLVVVAKDAGPWLEALTSLGDVEAQGEQAGWTHRLVRTSAKLRDLAIRVNGYVGPPGADAVVGYVGADRVISDGHTELPEVSLAEVKRVVGPPGKETLLGALKEVLKEGAQSPG
jgi:hypothetical protein